MIAAIWKPLSWGFQPTQRGEQALTASSANVQRRLAMKPSHIPLRTVVFVAAALFGSASLSEATGFNWKNLQSDIHGIAELTDARVVNPWGVARSNWATMFVVDNGTGVATQYR